MDCLKIYANKGISEKGYGEDVNLNFAEHVLKVATV